MRKLPIIALVVCIMAAVAGSAFAADIYTNTFTAGIAFTSTGSITCTATLRNLDGTGTPTAIGWTVPEPSVTQTGWKIANQCIEIVSTISTSGGIEIYTDNTAVTAVPRFTGDVSIPGVSAGGLIAAEDTTASPLPLCWRIVDAPTDYLHPSQGNTAFPDRIFDTALGQDYPCYLWMEDASSRPKTGGTVSNFMNADVKSYRVAKDERGIQHAEAGFLPGIVSPDYVYVAANFANAVSPRSYQTSKMIVHAYSE